MSKSGRIVEDHTKPCSECGREVEFPGGWFDSFAIYWDHLQAIAVKHGLQYVDDHPRLVEMLEDENPRLVESVRQANAEGYDWQS
jgi:hypothetical protein